MGSANVAGAHIEIKDGVSNVLASVSSDITVLPDVAHADFEREAEKALAATLDQLSRGRFPAPERVDVYFSSPWYAAQTRVAKVSRPTPFVVSRAFVDDMVSRELAAFESEVIAQSHEAGQPLRAIESKIVQAKLNGYATVEPIGLSARELEFSIFLSVAPERNLVRFEEMIRRTYDKKVSFATFAAASFQVLRDVFPHQDDYLHIDVGGEITDVSLVRESVLLRSVSFPKGRNFILRMLSEKLSRSIPESLALCTLYVEGKVEESVRDACTSVLTLAKNQWLDAFQRAIFASTNELSIPNTILISVSSDIAPWFLETMRREEFHQHSVAEREFKVVVLEAELFHERLSFGTDVPRDPFIMIDTLSSARSL